MSVNLKEAANVREWDYSAEDGGIDESLLGNYTGDNVFSVDLDEGFLKTPRSLKDLASEASVLNMSNDSGYEGVNSGLKKRINLEVSLTEEKQQMERMDYHAEEEVEEGPNFLGLILDILKMYVVVVSLLYMVYMSETAGGRELGGKKAAIQFYYDSQQQ